jgi:hypothetical protein
MSGCPAIPRRAQLHPIPYAILDTSPGSAAILSALARRWRELRSGHQLEHSPSQRSVVMARILGRRIGAPQDIRAGDIEARGGQTFSPLDPIGASGGGQVLVYGLYRNQGREPQGEE